MALRIADAAADARDHVRTGEYTGSTSGLAVGFAQANLVVLPVEDALDFVRFCVRNPKPCPLLEVTDTGSPQPRMLAPDADLRTDLPTTSLRPILQIAGLVVIHNVGFYIVFTFLPSYFTKTLGFTKMDAFISISVASVVALVLILPL